MSEIVWSGPPSLYGLLRPVAGLTDRPPDGRHHDRGRGCVASSLRAFGQQRPVVVDAAGTVWAGGEVVRAAARELGWTHIAAVVTNLEGEMLTAFALADNRTSDLAEWDFEFVAERFRGLDPALRPVAQFESFEVAALLAATWEPRDASDLQHTLFGEAPPPPLPEIPLLIASPSGPPATEVVVEPVPFDVPEQPVELERQPGEEPEDVRMTESPSTEDQLGLF